MLSFHGFIGLLNSQWISLRKWACAQNQHQWKNRSIELIPWTLVTIGKRSERDNRIGTVFQTDVLLLLVTRDFVPGYSRFARYCLPDNFYLLSPLEKVNFTKMLHWLSISYKGKKWDLGLFQVDSLFNFRFNFADWKKSLNNS